MIANVKITFLICLTFITSAVLVLSYSEYNHRYEVITTQNNGIYIFDKKTTTLNKCENGKCETIQTNFPSDRFFNSSLPNSVQAIPRENAMPQVIDQSVINNSSAVNGQLATQVPQSTPYPGTNPPPYNQHSTPLQQSSNMSLTSTTQKNTGQQQGINGSSQLGSNPQLLSGSQQWSSPRDLSNAKNSNYDGLPTLQSSLHT